MINDEHIRKLRQQRRLENEAILIALRHSRQQIREKLGVTPVWLDDLTQRYSELLDQ